MLDLPPQDEVLGRVVAWGEDDEMIRALVLTSSRARDDGSADVLSDYDLVVGATDASARAADTAWTGWYGRPLARWGDEHELFGETTWFRGVVYEDGVRIDYSLWPPKLLTRAAEADALPDDLDVGYRVLLDKDGVTAGWARATQSAYLLAPPSQAHFQALVDEFWWDAAATAKALARGEILFAKFLLDFDMKFVALRRMLEWQLAHDHDWSFRPGSHGRGLEQELDDATWSQLANTFVGCELDASWDALLSTIDVFARAARGVADACGYPYDEGVDRAMRAHLQAIRSDFPG